MKTKKLVILGAGEFAEIAYEYFTHDSTYEVIGFSVEQAYLDKTTWCGLPVVAFEEIEKHFPPHACDAFVAITYTQLNRARTKVYQTAKQKGYGFANYVSSKAFVWHNVTMGENCFIFENNVIQHKVSLGNNVILWSGNHIGHRATIADNCFISSHVVISGYCEIGKNCFIGVNSTFADFIKVGEDCFIGAGSLINKNCDAGKLYTMPAAAEASKVSTLRYFKISE